MKGIWLALAITTCSASTAMAQSTPWQMPPESDRCPSKWGAGDMRGSGNWMKPEIVLRAAKAIVQQQIRKVKIPTILFGGRRYDRVVTPGQLK